MTQHEEDQAGDWISVRHYFERILRERSEFDAERDRRLQERFYAQQQAITKAENTLHETLRGFPQEYAKREDLDRLAKEIAGITRDHVQRREFESVKTSQARIVGALVFIAVLLPLLTALVVHFI